MHFPGADVPVAVTVCSPRIVRVGLGANAASETSFVAPRTWAPTPFEATDGEVVRITTSDLQLACETKPLRLTFADAAGGWLLREPADGGMAVERGTDGSARVSRAVHLLGRAALLWPGPGRRRLDRLGTARQLWNSHLGHGPGSDIGIPLLISSRGYALFFDNPSKAILAVGRSDNGVRIDYTAEAGALTWYFLIGPDLRALMGEVTDLLGRAPMPPRWALGFLQSTRHFDDTAELRRLPRTIREKRIPCDALIYLSSYGEAKGWNRGVGHLEFQPDLWPQPAALLDEVRAQHFEFITHEYPVLHEASPLFDEAEARGYLLATGYERGTGGVANYRQGQRHSISRTRRCARGGGRRIATSSGSAWAAGGSTAAKDRRPPRRWPAEAAPPCTTSMIASVIRRSPTARRPRVPSSVPSSCAVPGPPECSGSGRRPGPATSTTTSRRSMLRSLWG